MDKKKEILFNLNNFLLSTSIVLDYVNNEKKATKLGHLKRVSYVALSLGVILKLDNKQLSDLCSYSLCSSLALNQANDNKTLCELSNEYVKDFPFIQKQKDILLYQKEHFDGSGIFGLKNEQIPLFSQIIFFATSLDEEFDLSSFDPVKKEKILNYIKSNENKLFSKQIVDSFFKINESINFWLDLENESDILLFIYTLLEDFSQALKFEELLKIANNFLKLVEPQSKLLDNIGKISDFYALEHKDKITLQIAAGFCKIGKLAVSKDILEKIEPLDIYEKEQIKTYPYYTKKVLSNIMGFNDIASWAMKVQERLDASGYIFGFENKSLSFKDRVLINANVYDALLQEKAYRRAYTKEEAIKIMKNESSKLDISITNDMAVIFKI